MSELISNLNTIESCKIDIKSAITAKGVDMTSASLADYASKIGEIQTGGTFVTEVLSVSVNNTYYPSQGVDGFSKVVVDVPQSVTGYTINDVATGKYNLTSLDCSASWIRAYTFYAQSFTTVNLPNCEQLGGTFYGEINGMGNCFERCGSLTTINLPVCTNIMGSTFMRCGSLQSIYLPMCSRIGSTTFAMCSNLSLVDLPICSYIGNTCFSMTNNTVTLTVYLRSTSVCSLGGNSVFWGKTNKSIYVPASLVDTYKTTTYWSSISNQIFSIPE